ncbi:MAG: hypothetical protein ACYS76_01965 [Planctomycetota bacterium]
MCKRLLTLPATARVFGTTKAKVHERFACSGATQQELRRRYYKTRGIESAVEVIRRAHRIR